MVAKHMDRFIQLQSNKSELHSTSSIRYFNPKLTILSNAINSTENLKLALATYKNKKIVYIS